jgi:hypothetical protein
VVDVVVLNYLDILFRVALASRFTIKNYKKANLLWWDYNLIQSKIRGERKDLGFEIPSFFIRFIFYLTIKIE